MKEEKDIEELFRSSLGDFEVTPPAKVREGINRSLTPRYGSGWFWFFTLAGLVAAGAIFFFSETGSGRAPHASLAQNASSTTASSRKTASGAVTVTPADSAAPSFTDVVGQTVAADPSASKTDHRGTNEELRKSGSETRRKHTFSGNSNDGKAITWSASRGSNKSKAARKKAVGRKMKTASGTGPTADVVQKSTTTERKSAQSDRADKERNTASLTGDNTLANDNVSQKQSEGSVGTGTKPGDAGNLANNGIKGDNSIGTSPGISKTGPDSGTKNDSVPPVVKDSIVTEQGTTNDPDKPKKNPPSGDSWMISVYGGPQFGLNKTTADNVYKSMSEKPSFRFSAEINRTLFSGFGLSTGVFYAQRKEQFDATTFNVNTYYTVDSVPIYDPQMPDSIIGWNTTDVLHNDTTKLNFRRMNSVSTFGFPLYVSKRFAFGDKWGLLVNAGAQFNFYKTTLGSSGDTLSASQSNSFGISPTVRLQATYKWNSWLFSAGLNGGLDLTPAIVYPGIDRRRYFITPQIGVHYTF